MYIKQKPSFGAKIFSDICPRTLPVLRSEQFTESAYLEENCELRGTDAGQGSEHIFAPN